MPLNASVAEASGNLRSVYLGVLRANFVEALALFDFPYPSIVASQRSTTTVPAQGLYMLTSPFVMRNAEAAAKQIEKAINNAGFTARVESLNTMDALIGSLPGHGVQNVRWPYVSVFNLAHLIPTSSIWTGDEKAPCPMYPALSPALMHCVTKGHTPFRLNLHARDVGHTIIFGPTGKGKSTLLALIIAQPCRYRDMSIFVFDKGMSLYPLTTACGGSHYTIAGDDESLAFCPLQFLETPSDKAWALEWIDNPGVGAGNEINPAR